MFRLLQQFLLNTGQPRTDCSVRIDLRGRRGGVAALCGGYVLLGSDGIQMQWFRVSDVGLPDGAVTDWSQCTRLVTLISTTVIQTGSNRASEDDEDYSTFPTPTGYEPAVVCEHWRCRGEVTDDMIVSIEYGIPLAFAKR